MPEPVVPSPKSHSNVSMVPSSSADALASKATWLSVITVVNDAVGASLGGGGVVTLKKSEAVSVAASSSVTVSVTV